MLTFAGTRRRVGVGAIGGQNGDKLQIGLERDGLSKAFDVAAIGNDGFVSCDRRPKESFVIG